MLALRLEHYSSKDKEQPASEFAREVTSSMELSYLEFRLRKVTREKVKLKEENYELEKQMRNVTWEKAAVATKLADAEDDST